MTDSEYMEEAAVLRPRLVGVARQYVGDEAEDVVQDAMLRLWDMHCKLHRPMEPMARVTVRNMCVDKLRRRNVMTDIPAADDDAAADAVREQIDRMMAIVRQLPAGQRDILRMRHMEGMEMSDIAEQTGCSAAAVRKALSRARQAVRERYREERRNK